MSDKKMRGRAEHSSPSPIKLEHLQNSILTAPCGRFLIDTVNLSGYTENVAKTLSVLFSIQNGNGRFSSEPVKTGRLRNLRVEVFKSGKVHIRGSLTAYFLGHNISPLPTQEYKKAVAEISQLLSINLGGFKVNRCDLALTIETTGKPSEYLRMLSDMLLSTGEAVSPDVIQGSRYYKTSVYQTISFYSKSDQLNLPQRKLLRIEYQKRKHIGRKRGGVTLLELIEPDFIASEMVSDFEEFFQTIGMNCSESEYDQKEIRKAFQKAVSASRKK